MPEAYTATRWRTFDGRDFATEDEAEAHERENFRSALTLLDFDQVSAAIDRKPEARHISDAIERAAYLISKGRREAGDLRRAPNGTRTPAPAEAAIDPNAPAQHALVNLPETETEAA